VTHQCISIGAVLVFLVLLAPGPSAATECFHFTLSWSEYTDIHETDAEVSPLLIVFEPPTVLFGLESDFEIWIEEGCCNDMNGFGYYGVHFSDWELQFDPLYVDSFESLRPT
jgi:hypothetical protein